ncbi:MAG TPA: TonB family protein [Polyangiaceae bacterium]|nr:TonB family protein [Polyangiaceae bacterium]
MFEMVLAEGAAGQTHRGAGAMASFFLHGAALVAAVALTAGARPAAPRIDKPLTVYNYVPPKPLAVTFQEPAAPGPAKPSRGGAVRTHAPQPASKPPPSNPERAAVNPAAPPVSLDANEGGGGPSEGPASGPPGPSSGGGGDGTGTGPGTGGGSVVLDMMPGMSRPVRVSGADPGYTREALQARVQGKVLAKCAIMPDGSVRNCRIIKGLPYMDQAVLQALAAQRYTPVTFQGRPVAVNYLFTFNFTLP